MKYTALFFCLSVMTLFSTGLQANTDDPALKAVHNAIGNFFGKNMEAYAACFSAQGELVNPMGMRMTGPQEIVAAHQPYLAMIKDVDTHAEVTREAVRYLGTDVALVSVSVESWSTFEGQNSEREPYTVLVTLSKQNGQWLIDQFQVTPVVPMGQG